MSRAGFIRFLFTSSALGFFLATARAAAPISPTIDGIRVGFAGHYKVGYWTPVEVQFSAGALNVAGNLEIVVPDGDGVPTRVAESVTAKAGQRTTVRLYVKFGRPRAPISVALRSAANQSLLAERTFSGDEVPAALSAGDKALAPKLILEMGSAVDFGSASSYSDDGDPEQAAVVHLEDPSQWPDRWYGFDGVDFVVLTTGKPEVYRQIPKAAIEALDRWLHLGGRILISVGSHGPELLAPGSPLARFAPGRFKSEFPLRRFGALENFAGTTEPLNSSGIDQAVVDVALLADIRGRIEAYEGNRAEDVPLVIRSAVGFGEATFVAIDLDESLLARWKARPEFLAALVGRGSAAASPGSGEPKARGMQYGYDDMIGQLRAGLDQFPDVRIVPFWLVAILAAGYILLLFPLDYLLGTKLRQGKGPGGAAWPWTRLGGIIAAVSLAVVLLNSHWKGSRVKGSQADVLDLDVESGLARGNTWFALYSPSSQAYSLELKPVWHGPHGEPIETQLSWLGLPGAGLGGMNARAAELPLFTEPYDLSAASARAGPVPLASRSSKCFTGCWNAPGARLIAADLRENGDRQLTGSIRMAEGANAQFKLTRGVLFYDRWAYVIDGFSADQPISVERLDERTAETLLTERRLIGDKDLTTPYDRDSLDRARILRIMLFYKAAGGRKYTGLLDRYQHELDFSDQLALGRAVLIGFGPPAAEIQVDGQTLPEASSAEHLTIYRFVMDVKKGT